MNDVRSKCDARPAYFVKRSIHIYVRRLATYADVMLLILFVFSIYAYLEGRRLKSGQYTQEKLIFRSRFAPRKRKMLLVLERTNSSLYFLSRR